MPANDPKIVVAAPPAIFDLLANCGARWDVQTRATTLGHMWSQLAGGELSNNAAAVILSTDLLDASELPLAAASMSTAPAALTFVLVGDPSSLDSVTDRIQAACISTKGANFARVMIVPAHDPLTLLDRLRAVLEPTVHFPSTWTTQALTDFQTPPTQQFTPAPIDTPPVEVIDVSALMPDTPQPPRTPVGRLPSPPQLPGLGSSPAAHPLPPLKVTPLPDQQTLTFTSGKGGAGKTTTAMGVAITIAAASEAAGHPLNVCVVDMDIETGQISAVVGEHQPTAFGLWEQPIKDPSTVQRFVRHVPNLGIDVLLAPVNPLHAKQLTPDFYRHVIRILKSLYDVVILDTSTRYHDPLISDVAAQESNGILFVTDMDKKSVRLLQIATTLMLSAEEYTGTPIPRSKLGIVVNKSAPGMGMTAELIKQAANNVAIVASIPADNGATTLTVNTGRLEAMLHHETMAPAWLKLAQACLKNSGHELAAATPAMASAGAAVSTTTLATGSTQQSTADTAPVPEREPAKRRRLLARFRSE